MPAAIDLAVVAEVLGDLGTEVEQLGVTLCLDQAVAARHVATLQAFDLIAQKQRALAALLRAECPVTALAELGLEELQQRLGPPSARPSPSA